MVEDKLSDFFLGSVAPSF